MKMLRVTVAVAAAMCLGTSSPASADLIHLGPSTFVGTGIGNVLTILNIQAQGGTDVAGAMIDPSGVTTDADTATQTPGTFQLRTFSEAGLTSGEEFALVFNINQPDDLVTLERLRVTFWAPGETDPNLFLHRATFGAVPQQFAQVGGGIGGAGHVFGLDAFQAATVTSLFALYTDLVVGVDARVSDAAGGFESFFLNRLDIQQEPPPVPEPAVLLLFGIGLALGTRRLSRR
jgi:hypothetical protein